MWELERSANIRLEIPERVLGHRRASEELLRLVSRAERLWQSRAACLSAGAGLLRAHPASVRAVFALSHVWLLLHGPGRAGCAYEYTAAAGTHPNKRQPAGVWRAGTVNAGIGVMTSVAPRG